jgi:hypothetical protein
MNMFDHKSWDGENDFEINIITSKMYLGIELW